MDVKYEKRNDELKIYLYGEIDEYYAKKVKNFLDNLIDDNCDVSSVLFDLSGVTFMDSTGIGMFIGRYKKCDKFGICTFVTGAKNSLDKILELSGIYRLISKK